MRRLNSRFESDYISEKGLDARERTYFAYVPLSNYVCYAVAEGYDDSVDIKSEQLAVESVLSIFQREPSIRASKIKKYINYANDQLKAHSTSNKLEASIFVVVSDYTRIRHAGCGSIKLFIVSDNQLTYESKTQTRYQDIIDGYINEADRKLDISEANNLIQYLGKDKRLEVAVSKKIALHEHSSLVMMTCNAWNKLLAYGNAGMNDISPGKRGVEITDAYEDAKTNSEFLLNIEEMLLNVQQFQTVRSYTIVSIAIAKTFKEDTAKIKKRRKILIIVGIILLVLIIIILVVTLLIRHSDRVALDEIIALDREGVRYSCFGNYIKASERYSAADELAKKLNTGNFQYIKEKRELIRKVRDRAALFSAIEEADNMIALGSYSNAKTLYIYIRNEADEHIELELVTVSRDTLRKINYFLEAANLTSLGEMYELSGLYAQALLNYNKALKFIELTEDFEKRKNLQLKIVDAERKLVEKEKAQIDIITSEAEKRSRELYDAQMEIINSLTVTAIAARNAGDTDKAIEYYNQIAGIYIDLG
ncbi:MAG: hypothetical protein FWD23_13525, partial [Oscillospiraceae bacterium]|nr:hypothetical protein [Oscillospiraceae bacterium]